VNIKSKIALLRAGVAPVIMVAALMTAPTKAQEVTPQAAEAPENDTIVVTGSRIPQPNLEGASPVTVVTAQDLKLQGTTRVEDMLNSLPQVFAGQSSTISNGASGIATVDLRGLGSERTLVLVNGRRLMPGDPTTSAADLNAIPAALIKNVEVLTGGASSTYGADAVAGVVNFKMDTEFEGFKLDGQYSLYQHDNNSNILTDALGRRGFPQPRGSSVNGGTIDITGVIGAGFDDGRGHVVAYAGYRKVKAVTQDSRDYSACATQARTPAQVAAAPSRLVDCGGSATSANGTFFDWASNTYQLGPNQTFAPGFTPYNFAPTNYFQRPDERYTAGFFADYEISDSLKPYMEAMFMDDRTVAQIAPSGNFGNTFTINCDNPLLSAAQLSVVCAPDNIVTAADGSVASGAAPYQFIDPTTGLPYTKGFLQILRRNVEGGPRKDDLQHTSYRIVGGMRGDLGSAWSYDAYYLFGRTNFAETYTNDFSIARLGRSLDVVTDANGNAICRSVRDGSDPNCVPWNIFTEGGVSAESLAYLQTPGFQRGNTQQRVLSGSMTGQLGEYGLKTPWADSGLGIAIGAEYRKESLELVTDTAFTTGDLAGQGAPTLSVSGSYDVKEVFGEMRLPIVEDNFFHSLTFQAAYRYSNYKVPGRDSFSTDTYKFAVDFAPVQDIMFRASYNRAVRAPNIQELFAPQRVALNGNSDPCTGADPQATLQQCILTGVTAAQYGSIAGNPAGQFNGLIGGNPDLNPEIATTKSLGVVFQPSFLPGFSATVDWFDIKIKNTIQQIGQDTIVATCIQTGDPTFCGLINRDQFGSLWRSPNGYVADLDQNIGGVKTRGIDVNVAYGHEVGSLGKLSFSLIGTWLDKLVTDNGVSAPYDCAKLYGLQCGTPNPEWRHKARLSFNTANGLGASLQWRYFSKVNLDLTSDNETLAGPSWAPFNETIKAQSYFDLALTADITSAYRFSLGVQNMFDRDPPIIGSNGTSSVVNACASVVCNGNTYPGVYDALGRYIYAGVTLSF
jgi:iron complex outermembrane receptor protein